MFPQTVVPLAPGLSVPGAIARSSSKQNIDKRRANGIVYPGRYVVFNGEECAHPSAEPGIGARGGVAMKNEATVDGSWPDDTMVDVLCTGFIFVDPEGAVAADSQAYVRYAVETAEELGAFRGDPAGTGGITITVDEAADNSNYTFVLDGVLFKINSGGSATTTTIATALKNRVDAHANYTATNPTGPTILVVRDPVTDPIAVTSRDARVSYEAHTAAFALPGAIFRRTLGDVTELELGAN